MARTALLTNEELLFLKQAIVEKFRRTNPYAQEFKPNAFLPNYNELKQSMEVALPDMATSISLKRLRKLFYDTDTERREPGKVVKPNFGVDFLNACYLYITDKKHNRQSYLLNNKNQESTPSINSLLRKRLIIPGLGLLFIIIIVAVIWLFYLQQTVPYYQDFDFASSEHMIETLNNEGWNILDVDSNFLYKQDKPGHLALYTLAGDYWIKPNENPVIKNLFVKKLDCRNCTIELSIKDFNPSKPWEQAGIFFLDANLSRSVHMHLLWIQIFLLIYFKVSMEKKIPLMR